MRSSPLRASTTDRKAALIAALRDIAHRQHARSNEAFNDHLEEEHMEADGALLSFIDDPDVVSAFHAIHKWYA